MAPFRILGIGFDHMHMGDLLAEAHAHPGAEIAGLFDPDPARTTAAARAFAVPPERVFTHLATCLAEAPADLAIVCTATASHAETVATLAPTGMSVLVEKPFAARSGEARAMIAAMAAGGGRLAVNWPAAWAPCHVTAHRLLREGAIGTPLEVHYHGGNRGPLYHLAGKVEVSEAEVAAEKPRSWWYRAAAGGGSLRDYLGYGATLGTWFMGGEAPLEVTTVARIPPGLEVDEHSITVCRYARGLSKLETRWGTLTDPWTIQPQPRCGFVLVGSDGSLSSYDHDPFVTLQTRAAPAPARIPADTLPADRRGPIGYLLARLADGGPIEGPLDPAVSLLGQRIIDSAVLSAAAGRTVPLVP